MANPLMETKAYSHIKRSNDSDNMMTLAWTVNKTIILISVTIASAITVWSNAEIFFPFIVPLVIIAFIIAMIVVYAKKTAPYLSFVYALLEWIVIGVISAYYEKLFPGIVVQAVAATFWVFGMMLFLYKTQIIKATENFKLWVVSATGWIMILYLISILGSLTWWFNVPYIHESWLVWILFSVFVVGIAALNLVIDFDNIEAWVKMKLPKYMEWYNSFGLLITLIWLYLEILKLISKSRR